MSGVFASRPRMLQTIIHSAGRSSSPSRYDHRVWLSALIVYVLAVHAGFFTYDVLHKFAPFLGADRVVDRMEAMTRLLGARTWRDAYHTLVANNVIIGEYIVQAGLYAVGGVLAIVIFQVLLQLGAVLAVFRIALLTLGSLPLSVAAACVYATLPHSLVFPHQLSSEAIGIPVMVIGYWLFFEYRVGGRSVGYGLGGGALLGLAALVRPQIVLLPILLAPFAVRDRSRWAMAGAASFVAVGLLPMVLWVALVWSSTGRPSLGNKDASVGYNLYLRAFRISRSASPAEGAAMTDRYLLRDVPAACADSLRSYLADPHVQWIAADCTLSLPRYVSFVVHYPGASARDFLRDLLTLAAKSGMSKLTIDYLDPNFLSRNRLAVQSMKYGWRTIFESQGLLAAIRGAAKVNRPAVMAELAGAVVFSTLFLCFLAGLAIAARTAVNSAVPGERRAGLGVLGLHPLYIFVTMLLADAAQSRHRYPAEFAICILATLGAATALSAYRERRRREHGLADAARPEVG